MFLVNGMKATLRQFNRNKLDSIYDDEDYQDVPIKCCPYNADEGIRFGIYTVPEATGYYQVHRHVDVREGDQLIFNGPDGEVINQRVHTILKVQDEWLFNRVENKVLAIK